VTETTVTAVALSPSGLVLDDGEQVRLCASLFYFRIPRESWASRLAAVRASGYDLIDVYVPWNFHEVAPGRWDFEGRRDVAAFLDLAHDAGLRVIARPGPYICSEWDGGALPAWLTLEEGLRLRQNEPRYLAHVEAWFGQILPLLAERWVRVRQRPGNLGLGTALAPVFVAIFVGLGIWWGLPLLVSVLPSI
jgi:sugar phosphate isomerase/epimerase